MTRVPALTRPITDDLLFTVRPFVRSRFPCRRGAADIATMNPELRRLRPVENAGRSHGLHSPPSALTLRRTTPISKGENLRRHARASTTPFRRTLSTTRSKRDSAGSASQLNRRARVLDAVGGRHGHPGQDGSEPHEPHLGSRGQSRPAKSLRRRRLPPTAGFVPTLYSLLRSILGVRRRWWCKALT
jgi:hypothetical protein